MTENKKKLSYDVLDRLLSMENPKYRKHNMSSIAQDLWGKIKQTASPFTDSDMASFILDEFSFSDEETLKEIINDCVWHFGKGNKDKIHAYVLEFKSSDNYTRDF